MKLSLILITFFMAGCTFAAQPDTIYPTPMPTPTLAIVTRPIAETDREAAFEFFYHLKVHIISSEYEHIAEEIRYPITVNVEGNPRTYVYVSEFSADFHDIFREELIQRIISTDESELAFTPDGVSVADGLIIFDWICQDSACQEAKFLITQINN